MIGCALPPDPSFLRRDGIHPLATRAPRDRHARELFLRAFARGPSRTNGCEPAREGECKAMPTSTQMKTGRDVDQLRQLALRMGGLAEEILEKALRSTWRRDAALADVGDGGRPRDRSHRRRDRRGGLERAGAAGAGRDRSAPGDRDQHHGDGSRAGGRPGAQHRGLCATTLRTGAGRGAGGAEDPRRGLPTGALGIARRLRGSRCRARTFGARRRQRDRFDRGSDFVRGRDRQDPGASPRPRASRSI